ncbi:hypothetical protein OIU85_024398 [Salix viminalis]|uniref:Uncharacterized protein n=1 Tax=Salix viminalis TaxID=40686 RepID=A0A9Q0Z4S2_SALVM|nr:hypothetical protein OIU85_024398 [Salix viminalis]
MERGYSPLKILLWASTFNNGLLAETAMGFEAVDSEDEFDSGLYDHELTAASSAMATILDSKGSREKDWIQIS